MPAHKGLRYDVGSIVQKFEVLEVVRTDVSKNVKFKVQCLICGTESLKNAGYLYKIGKEGLDIGCLKCHSESIRRTDSQPAQRYAFKRYQWGAKNRDIHFEISFEDFLDVVNNNCTYCGNPPYLQRGPKEWQEKAAMNGIDRMDNSVGYVKGNITPCCRECNHAKRDMSMESWKEFCARIGRHKWYLSDLS